MSLEGSIRNTYTHQIDSLEFYWNYNDIYSKSNNRNSDAKEFRLSANGQFNVSHQTKKGHLIKLLSRINGVSNPKESSFIEPFILQKENKNFAAQSFVNQLDLEFPIIKTKNDTLKSEFLTFETGLKSAYRKFNEDYKLYEFNPSIVTYEKRHDFSNSLNYDEDIHFHERK